MRFSRDILSVAVLREMTGGVASDPPEERLREDAQAFAGADAQTAPQSPTHCQKVRRSRQKTPLVRKIRKKRRLKDCPASKVERTHT